MQTHRRETNVKTKPIQQEAVPHLSDFLAVLRTLRTQQTYRYMLGVFAVYAAEHFGQVPLDPLLWTDKLIADYYEWLLHRKHKRSAVASAIAALKRYLTWLSAHNHLSPDFRLDRAVILWKDVRGNRYTSESRVRHADPDVPRIVNYYDAIDLPVGDASTIQRRRLEILRDRAIVHTLYDSAARVSEISELTREALSDGRLGECRIIGKGGRERLFVITLEAQAAIRAYCIERRDDFPGLFISHGRNIGKSLGRGMIWTIVKRAADALGIKGFSSPHAFRHYRAQQLLDGGMDLAVLQSFLGHKDINLTRRVYAPGTPASKLRDQLTRFGLDAKTAVQGGEHV